MNNNATTHPLPIFVYGTLMIGQPNDHLWQDAVLHFEEALMIDCCLYDLGYYPVMVEKPGRKVMGQLVRLEEGRFSQRIQILDYLEGFDPGQPEGSDFRRVQMRATTLDGDRVLAWTYVGDEARVGALPVVEHGDWAEHVAEMNDFIASWWEKITTVLDDKRRLGGAGDQRGVNAV